MCGHHQLRFVIYQQDPDVWVVQGLEHNLLTEARTIGEAVRGIVRLVETHSAVDTHRDLAPLSGFRPAPQAYWNMFNGGTPVPLSQLGVTAPAPWEISLALARHRPLEASGEREALARSVRQRPERSVD
jgi:hypothetical protein